jgi:hypothetical protein
LRKRSIELDHPTTTRRNDTHTVFATAAKISVARHLFAVPEVSFSRGENDALDADVTYLDGGATLSAKERMAVCFAPYVARFISDTTNPTARDAIRQHIDTLSDDQEAALTCAFTYLKDDWEGFTKEWSRLDVMVREKHLPPGF